MKTLFLLLFSIMISLNSYAAEADSETLIAHGYVSSLPECEGGQDSYRTDCVGTYKWQNGWEYFGEFQNGMRNGVGIFNYKDPDAEYFGEIINDAFSGSGIMTYPDGAVWAGEYKNDQVNGLGVYVFDDFIEQGIYSDNSFQSVKKYLPKNASKKDTYSGSYLTNGWTCNPGYQKFKNYICLKSNSTTSVSIPTNAKASGSSWTCNPGFTKTGKTCTNNAELEKKKLDEQEKLKEQTRAEEETKELSSFSTQGSCPGGGEPIKTISADGSYFEYKCGEVEVLKVDDLYYPTGAPKIASDYLSTTGVDGYTKREIKHRGIDIPGNNGWLILATADGIVIDIERDECSGLGVYIDHGKGFDGNKIIAIYTHLGKLLVGNGEQVNRGQPIASLGNTHLNNVFWCQGGVRHLHFEISPSIYDFYEHSKPALNPHLYWANGPYKITCFEKNKIFKEGTLTYPFSCQGNEKLIVGNWEKGIAAFETGDYATALREFKIIAELGDKTAQSYLGYMYNSGIGTNLNYKTAAKWYKLSAEQGEPTAQGNLARMYYSGNGVMQDFTYSYMWAHISNTVDLIDLLKVRMTSADISKSKKLARECIAKDFKGC